MSCIKCPLGDLKPNLHEYNLCTRWDPVKRRGGGEARIRGVGMKSLDFSLFWPRISQEWQNASEILDTVCALPWEASRFTKVDLLKNIVPASHGVGGRNLTWQPLLYSTPLSHLNFNQNISTSVHSSQGSEQIICQLPATLLLPQRCLLIINSLPTQDLLPIPPMYLNDIIIHPTVQDRSVRIGSNTLPFKIKLKVKVYLFCFLQFSLIRYAFPFSTTIVLIRGNISFY